jgi:hypothetical protein
MEQDEGNTLYADSKEVVVMSSGDDGDGPSSSRENIKIQRRGSHCQ